MPPPKARKRTAGAPRGHEAEGPLPQASRAPRTSCHEEGKAEQAFPPVGPGVPEGAGGPLGGGERRPKAELGGRAPRDFRRKSKRI